MNCLNMNHIMIDLVTLNEKTTSPICAVEAILFDPETGELGDSVYIPVDIRSNEELKGKIAISDAFNWMQLDSERRAALIAASATEDDALRELAVFISGYRPSLSTPYYLWFKDAQKKKATLDYAFYRNDIHTPHQPATHLCCMRPLLELAAATGYMPHPRRNDEIYTLTDAVYQAEQVCNIWQRLLRPYSNPSFNA